ncbi:MAG: serine acetyltransferase, partial [Eubacteriales bacterium]|nr:serine acetyltransferase [Eubacteriales bacterium]
RQERRKEGMPSGMLKNMKRLLRSWKCILPDILYYTGKAEMKRLVREDVAHYMIWHPDWVSTSFCRRLNTLLVYEKPFRNVFYYRVGKGILAQLSAVFLQPLKTVEIGGRIEGGLVVSHNFSVISPETAGKNLRIGPGVVIGNNRDCYPVIGDNVYIASNATVIGDIRIGNNVIIGAGSVVTKDVPDNSVYVGNPAHLLRTLD